MYGLKVYITPQDVIDKLSDEDKERFNQCVFTNITKDCDGSIEIDCVLFNDPDPYIKAMHRQRYYGKDETSVLTVKIPKLPTTTDISEDVEDDDWEFK